MQNRKEIVPIVLGGLMVSGKTAIRDLLSEIKSIYSPNPIHEFVLFAHPGGLLDLECSLVNNWNQFFSDIGIKRFESLLKQLRKKYSSPYFFKTHKDISDSFFEISEKYINELKEIRFKGMWYGNNNFLQKIFRKFNILLGKRFFSFYQKEMYFCSGYELFYKKTRDYLSSLLLNITPSDKSYYVLMEGYVSLQYQRILNLLPNGKIIITLRDPRDIYITLKEKVLADYFPIEKVEDFIFAYKETRENFLRQKLNKNVLIFNFEDLIFHYEDILNRIYTFLNVTPEDHILKGKFFNPNISRKNIRMWEYYPNKNEIDKIYEALREYCYF